MGIVQIALNPLSVKRANMEKSAPNHPLLLLDLGNFHLVVFGARGVMMALRLEVISQLWNHQQSKSSQLKNHKVM